MNEFERPTAKIYQFPVKRSAAGRRNFGHDAPHAQRAAAPSVHIEYGSSRYHDAAIQEEIKRGKH